MAHGHRFVVTAHANVMPERDKYGNIMAGGVIGAKRAAEKLAAVIAKLCAEAGAQVTLSVKERKPW